ncbi:MAG: YCF48-related protein [Candidatus Portnoybacteria bacterium]|nr:YCF48-related protein [Candidatus Portnoybacteria bacterium]MDD4982413.1 YCF48-related protein [Candidatus Portnoybacteria bacterium]
MILPVFFTGILAAFPFDCSTARDGGVWRSLNRGETWEQKTTISKNQNISASNISFITLDPRTPNIVYAGTRGEGIYKSSDGGDIWYHLDDMNSVFDKRANVYDIAIDPRDTNILYAGIYQNKLGRLLRSGDAGKSWQEVYRVSREQYAVFAVEIDSYDPSVVYMGTAEGGFLKSTDYGKSWKVIKWFDDVITDIKVNPHDTRTVFVSTYDKGVYKTNDKGNTWQALENLKNFPGEMQEMQVLVMDNKNPEVLYVGSKSGLLKSTDTGQSWQRVNIAIPPSSVSVSAIALDPVTSFFLYYAAGNVVYRTQDNGQTWTLHPINSVKTVNAIAIDPQNPQVIYAGLGE